MFARPYSAEERRQIKLWRSQNISLKNIAERLGRPYHGLRSFVSDEGIVREPKINRLRRNQDDVLKMRDEGYSAVEIAAKYGVTRRVVYKFYEQLQLNGAKHES